MIKVCSFFVFQFEEEEELALIFLQKVIRGRAIQNMVSFGIRSSIPACQGYIRIPIFLIFGQHFFFWLFDYNIF